MKYLIYYEILMMLVLQIMTLKIPNKFFIPSQIVALTSHTITPLDACVYLYWYTAGCTLQAVTSSGIYLLFSVSPGSFQPVRCFLKINMGCPGHDTSCSFAIKQYKHTHPQTYIKAYALKHIYYMHPQTLIQAESHTHTRTHRLVRAQCKIRGAVNGGGQLGCCFIKVQRKCRSVSCRMQGIGSASFCLPNLKHIPAGIRQPLPPNSAFLMVRPREIFTQRLRVLIRPSGARTCPSAR